MKSVDILLICCILLSLKKSTSSEEQYEVKIFRTITPVRSDGKSPYLEKYPRADTDKLSPEERLQHCRLGYDHVLKHEKGQHFQLLKNEKTGKLKAYVLVNSSSSEDKSDDDVQVRLAYQCPTAPLSYIHIHFEPAKEEVPTFWVIIKDSGQPFNFNFINTYFLHLVGYIREAHAEEVSSLPEDEIATSAFDSDELSEEQRLRICRRAMNMSPEMGIVFADDIKTGKSKYIIFDLPEWETEKRAHRDEAEAEKKTIEKQLSDVNQDLESEDETDNGNGEGRSSERKGGVMQAFTCPTVPEIYVGVPEINEEKYTLLVAVSKNEIKNRPVFNIRGYEFIIANFISKVHEEANSKDEREEKDYEGIRSRTYASTEEKSSRKWLSNDELSQKDTALNDPIAQNELDRRMTSTSEEVDCAPKDIQELLDEQDVSIDTNEFTEAERRFICKKAIKTVLGENAKFVEGSAGQNAHYRFLESQKNKSFASLGEYQSEKVVKAFTCPTQPITYVRVVGRCTENLNLVQVMVTGKDLALSLMEFK